MRIPLLLAFTLLASPALAATCAPVSTSASILASPDMGDIHPDWVDSTIGLSFSLDLRGDEAGADGGHYLYGDVIDPRGGLVTEGVYVSDMEWECDAQ